LWLSKPYLTQDAIKLNVPVVNKAWIYACWRAFREETPFNPKDVCVVQNHSPTLPSYIVMHTSSLKSSCYFPLLDVLSA
jgi:hypothetical protein